MHQEAVEDLLELIYLGDVDLHQEAVLTGDAVALHDFGSALGELDDAPKLAGSRTNADERGHRKPECFGIHIEAVAGNDTGLLQPLDALSDGGRGHPDPASQLGHRHAGVGGKLGEEPEVGGVERSDWFQGATPLVQ